MLSSDGNVVDRALFISASVQIAGFRFGLVCVVGKFSSSVESSDVG